jgi:signal transduction histidine kinase
LGTSLSSTTVNYTDRVKQQFDRILEGADRMSRLIEDSVTLARVSTTREFKRENVRLASECQRLVNDFCETHQKSVSDVSILIEPEVILHNMAHFPLSNCLSNLICNAIQYTPEPGKKVKISYSLTDQGFKHRIIIEDEGVGVPERLRDELFRPSNRGENVHSIKGRGLGLAIVKKSVELLQGELLAEHLQLGTRFTLLLPNKDVKPWELAQSP